MTGLTQLLKRLRILELLITEQKVIIDGKVHLYLLFASQWQNGQYKSWEADYSRYDLQRLFEDFMIIQP